MPDQACLFLEMILYPGDPVNVNVPVNTRGKRSTLGLSRDIHIDVSVLHFKSSSE